MCCLYHTLEYAGWFLAGYAVYSKNSAAAFSAAATFAFLMYQDKKSREIFLNIERDVQRSMGSSYPGPLDATGNYPTQ